jgi:acyl-CoA synthetase (NDP forming)
MDADRARPGPEPGWSAGDALRRLFAPRSVAVIGASRRRDSIGWQILDNLLRFGFEGPVYPVNPSAGSVHSLHCHPGVEDIPDPVDLAVVAVPAAEVPAVVRACARKGVGGLVVVSSGFAEMGPLGRAREDELRSLVRGAGMRMIGPNCMGIVNTDPAVRLDAVFAGALPVRGNVAFVSQSGAFGAAVLNQAATMGIGFSLFASLGNRGDVSVNDLLECLEADAATRVVLLYFESLGNPRNFTRIARRVSRTKPVLAVKAARTAAGALAASSHTGALADPEAVLDAVFEQCGVLRVRNVEDLFGAARAFSTLPPPAGGRVAVITNGGGPAVMAVDALVSHGLGVPPLPEAAIHSLRDALPGLATIANPVDLTGTAEARHFQAAIQELAHGGGFDALIVICVPTLRTDAGEILVAAAEAMARTRLPVLGVVMAPHEAASSARSRRPDLPPIPLYAYPEAAAHALALLVRHEALRREPEEVAAPLPMDHAAIGKEIAAAAGGKRSWLRLDEGYRLLRAAGIPCVASTWARTAEEARDAALGRDGAWVVKAEVPGLVHKSEAGAVRLALAGPAAVLEACHAMQRSLEAQGGPGPAGFLLQEEVPAGRETILGFSRDPVFGPVLMFGLGGIHVEVLRDVAFAAAPLTAREASRIVRQIRGYPLLAGVRGQPPVDFAALEETLRRLGQLAVDFPSILEIDLNPFVAQPEPGTSLAVDWRIRIAGDPQPGCEARHAPESRARTSASEVGPKSA